MKDGGRFLYLGEVHKYPGWSRELKTVYGALPSLHVYFTGSSVLDTERGESDPSRRAPRYALQGLSFREYLAIAHNIFVRPFTLEEVLEHEAAVPQFASLSPSMGAKLRRLMAVASTPAPLSRT